MKEADEICWLVHIFSKPLNQLWNDLPQDFLPVVIIHNAECHTAFEFLYLLLESHFESSGAKLELNWKEDRSLIMKLEELRVLTRFIDNMSNISPQLFDRPADIENPFSANQDLIIWKVFQRVCFDVGRETKMNWHFDKCITFEALLDKYRVTAVQDKLISPMKIGIGVQFMKGNRCLGAPTVGLASWPSRRSALPEIRQMTDTSLMSDDR